MSNIGNVFYLYFHPGIIMCWWKVFHIFADFEEILGKDLATTFRVGNVTSL